MKKILLPLFLALGYSSWAQTTTVTATLTDSDGLVWNGCAYQANLISPNGTPFINGVRVTATQVNGVCDATGTFVQVLATTNSITPTGAYWNFRIASLTSAPASTNITVTTIGTTQNSSSGISAQLVAPRFAVGFANAYGYGDVEVQSIPLPGGFYYNTGLVNPGQRIWSGLAWAASGGGGGGGNTTSTALTNNTLAKANGANSIVNSLCVENGTTFNCTDTGGGVFVSVTTTGGGGVAGTSTCTEGTAPSGVAASDVLWCDSTAHRFKVNNNNVGAFGVAQLIASGTSALGTTAIASATCATVVTTAATGVLSTDAISWGPNGVNQSHQRIRSRRHWRPYNRSLSHSRKRKLRRMQLDR